MAKTMKLWRPIWTSDTYKKSVLPNIYVITDTKDKAEDIFLDIAEDYPSELNIKNTETYVLAKQIKVSQKVLQKIKEDEEFRGRSVLTK